MLNEFIEEMLKLPVNAEITPELYSKINIFLASDAAINEEDLIDLLQRAKTQKYQVGNYFEHLLENNDLIKIFEQVIMNGPPSKIYDFINNETIVLIDSFRPELADAKDKLLGEIINNKIRSKNYFSTNPDSAVYKDLLAMNKGAPPNIEAMKFIIAIAADRNNNFFDELMDPQRWQTVMNSTAEKDLVKKEVFNLLLTNEIILPYHLIKEVNASLDKITEIIENKDKYHVVEASKFTEIKIFKGVLQDNIGNFKSEDLVDLQKLNDDLSKQLKDLEKISEKTINTKIVDAILNVIGVFTDKFKEHLSENKIAKKSQDVAENIENKAKNFTDRISLQRKEINDRPKQV